MSHPIPVITHELGRHWDQPDREQIAVDETHALMDVATFKALPDYSLSQPSGVYDGKMWRRRIYDSRNCRWTDEWVLCWYGPAADPGYCATNTREIIVV